MAWRAWNETTRRTARSNVHVHNQPDIYVDGDESGTPLGAVVNARNARLSVSREHIHSAGARTTRSRPSLPSEEPDSIGRASIWPGQSIRTRTHCSCLGFSVAIGTESSLLVLWKDGLVANGSLCILPVSTFDITGGAERVASDLFKNRRLGPANQLLRRSAIAVAKAEAGHYVRFCKSSLVRSGRATWERRLPFAETLSRLPRLNATSRDGQHLAFGSRTPFILAKRTGLR